MGLVEILNLARATTLSPYGYSYSEEGSEDEKALITILNYSIKVVYSKLPIIKTNHRIDIENGRLLYNIPKCVNVVYASGSDGTGISINNQTEGIVKSTSNSVRISNKVASTNSYIDLVLHNDSDTVTADNIDYLDLLPDVSVVAPILSYMAYLVSKKISENDGQQHLSNFNREISELEMSGRYSTITSTDYRGTFNV